MAQKTAARRSKADLAARSATARGAGPRSGDGAGRPQQRPPERASARWPWNLSRARLAWLVVAAVAVVALVVVAVVWAVTRGPDDGASGAYAVDPARVAELEAAEVVRDAENLGVVTDFAVSAQERLVPTMHELSVALPLDGAPGTPATPEQLAAWRDQLAALTAEAEALPTGASGYNVTRNGLGVSIALLGDALDTLELAEGSAEPARAQLLALAADLRLRAADTWSMAATQLDDLSVAADQGHVHVFLPLHPDDAGDGAASLGESDH
ncbi:hypothetical protein [Oerskovia enterophila]|uniref:DUF4012 domain-containing protein n=1 Tax=Oerskovia enterophila TaxID=43678 RepID=A0ABX2Y221_9CELL|nr:hypothetical protein [Oerskovia enterophila]OCI30496.1 hypothetical protein OERS_28250 [Oerskovia enterophila]